MEQIPEALMREVRRLYAEQPQVRCFQEDLQAHLMHKQGYVFLTENLLLVGRAVSKHGTREQLGDPFFEFNKLLCDAWYVWLAVGEVQEIMRYIPYPLPWIAFARRGRLKWYEWEKLRRRGKGKKFRRSAG